VSAPALTLSTSALAFGSVTVGQTKDLALTVSNTGNAALAVSSSGISGAGFSLTTASSFTVQPGASQSVTVRFAPASAVAASGTLTFTSNDPSSPTTVALTGTGTSTTSGSPKLTLSINALSFGTVNVGQTKDLPVTASNTGNATLTVNSVTVTGAGFSLGSAASFALAPGTSQAITVHYAPASAGASSGTLTIASNDAGSPVSVGLSGTGAGATASSAISVNPSSLAFGNVTVGQTATLPLTVSNTGTASLNISSLTAGTPFSVVSPATPVTVNAGGSATVTVKFAPSSAGSTAGTLAIASNDPSKPTLNVPLTGTGVAAGSSTITLQIDGGPPYDMVFGYSQGQKGAVFVNRLTPPSYPATLQSVQIYFGNRANGLPAGTPINLVWGNTTLFAAPVQIAQVGAFNTYTLGTPFTITSGDFYVGFQVDNPAAVYPVDYETTSGSKQRSYFGTSSLALIDSVGAPGNFGMRAVISVGGP
jgi:hypothetical protein